MMLSYRKLRNVLTILLKNEKLREAFSKLVSGDEISISELEFLDLLAESNMDLDVLDALTDGYTDDISADFAIETFTDFFISIKSSWEAFQKLLLSLGFQTEVKTNTPLKN